MCVCVCVKLKLTIATPERASVLPSSVTFSAQIYFKQQFNKWSHDSDMLITWLDVLITWLGELITWLDVLITWLGELITCWWCAHHMLVHVPHHCPEPK